MADEAIYNSKIVISADASPAAQEADRLAREIDETTASEFAASHPSQEQPAANKEDQPRGKTTEGTNSGSFAPADGCDELKREDAKVDDKGEKSNINVASDEKVNAFLDGPIEDIEVEFADRLLEKGFTVVDKAGNTAHFGKRMKKHIEDHSQEEADRSKRRLRSGVELVKTTTPVISVRDENVSCYFGSVKGKKYLVMADNSGEVYEVWDQFRRDKWSNIEKKGVSSGQPADATEPRTPARKRSIVPTSSNRPDDGSSHDIEGRRT